MNKQEISDGEIVKLVLSGDIQMYAVLVSRYEKFVFSYLLSKYTDVYEIEDVVQETFLKAYRHLGSYDCERKFSNWLLTIARNLLYDNRKKNSRSVASTDLVTDVLLNTDGKDIIQPDEVALKKEQFRQLATLIKSLDEDFRIPFILRVVNELSYQEIADALELPLQTVKNRIFKARTYLREKRENTK